MGLMKPNRQRKTPVPALSPYGVVCSALLAWVTPATREFLRSAATLESKVVNNAEDPNLSNHDDAREEKPDPAFPPIDSVNTRTARHRVFTENVYRVLPVVDAEFKLELCCYSADLNNFIRTFELRKEYLSFNTSFWLVFATLILSG
eukprot:Colp12_sorted_trinity150504_noHs@11003